MCELEVSLEVSRYSNGMQNYIYEALNESVLAGLYGEHICY